MIVVVVFNALEILIKQNLKNEREIKEMTYDLRRKRKRRWTQGCWRPRWTRPLALLSLPVLMSFVLSQYPNLLSFHPLIAQHHRIPSAAADNGGGAFTGYQKLV